jgi:hypothetical protein
MATAVALTASGASALTLSSTVTQSGHSGSSGTYPITGASPYDYTAQSYLSLTSLDGLSITLTISDGDSASGDFDFNNLTLELDGIDTGIMLNGFRENQIDTHTLSGTPLNAAAILTALQADGKLVGTVKDLDEPGTNALSLPAAFQTTLSLEGSSEPTPTPEPTTLSLLGVGLGGLVMYRRRKKLSA